MVGERQRAGKSARQTRPSRPGVGWFGGRASLEGVAEGHHSPIDPFPRPVPEDDHFRGRGRALFGVSQHSMRRSLFVMHAFYSQS